MIYSVTKPFSDKFPQYLESCIFSLPDFSSNILELATTLQVGSVVRQLSEKRKRSKISVRTRRKVISGNLCVLYTLRQLIGRRQVQTQTKICFNDMLTSLHYDFLYLSFSFTWCSFSSSWHGGLDNISQLFALVSVLQAQEFLLPLASFSKWVCVFNNFI